MKTLAEMLAAPVSLSVEQAARLEVRVVELERALADYASRYGMTDEARHLLVEEPGRFGRKPAAPLTDNDAGREAP